MYQSPYYGNTNNPYGQAQRNSYGQPQNNPYEQAQNPQINQSRNSGNIAAQAIQAASMARQNNLNPNIQENGYVDNKNSGQLYDSARSGFIRKVYSILSIQLLVTALICYWAMNSQTFKKIFVNTVATIILSVLLMVVSCAIGCFMGTTRKYGLPILIVFTLIFALLIGIVCASSNPQTVLTATLITAAIVIALTIFACVTKTDLTGCGPYLIVLCLVMIIFGIVCIFWRSPIVQLVYACLSALLFGIYLIFDTQMVLGKFTNAYTLDDAYFAAIQLYIDIMQIFLQILRILSYANN